MTRGTQRNFSRRRLLQGFGATSAAWLLRDLFPAVAQAEGFDPMTAPILLVCTFEGGWDQMLALDPRDALKFDGSGKIDPAYNLVAGSDLSVSQALAQTGGRGTITPAGSNITFGPAIGTLQEQFEDLCVIRGVNMGTLTHEVGRRYLLTGKFPRGLAANGSSLTTWHAHNTGDLSPIPNLVVGGEAYNEGLDNFATALKIQSSTDLLTVLSAIGEPLSPESSAAVSDYLWSDSCSDLLYDGNEMVTTFLDSRSKALTLASGDLAQHFAFSNNPPPTMQALYSAFGLSGGGINQALNGATGQAMLAAQAISQGVSQAVSVRLATGIDHHDDSYQTDHAPALREGFDALSNLIAYLKNTPDANGAPFWDRTTVLVTSDFARTPGINGRGGRDHHLASSCLLAGRGIRGNQVIGATDDVEMGAQRINASTGQVDAEGVEIRPPDIHATLLQAMGLSYDHISNQDPVLLESALA